MSPATNGFLEACGGSNTVNCSVYPGVCNGISTDGRDVNDILSEALADGFGTAVAETESRRIGRTRSRSTSRADSTTVRINNRYDGSLERSLHRQRSRPLHVRTQSSASRDLNKSDQDFMLPQYIGNMYTEKKPTSRDHMSLQSSFLPDGDNSSDLLFIRYHIGYLPHGVVWTILAILISWGGLGFAFLTRQSLNFVRLEDPWRVGAIYNDVYSLGVINVAICYNETVSRIEDSTRVGCFSVPLATTDDLNDPILKLTAVFASLSVMLGFILTVAMTTALCWRTINFKACGTGYLFACCFQALSFLIFDTDICEDNKCKVDIGCGYCVVASLLWVCGCMVCAKMESNRIRYDLAEQRKRRKNEVTKAFVRMQSIVHRSCATVKTERTASTASDERSLDPDEEAPSTSTGSRECSKKGSTLRTTEDFALFDDLTTETMKKPHRKTITAIERQHHSAFKRPSSIRLATGKSGIERQHDSIVRLDPAARSGWYLSEGYTTVSALTQTSKDNTLSNLSRDRVEHDVNALPVRRGRSRSGCRSRVETRRDNDTRRSASRGRSSSAITRHRSNSATPRHRSNSATPRHRSNSATHMGRSHGKSRRISTIPIHVKTATRYREEPAHVARQAKRVVLPRDARPTRSGVTGYASIPKSPLQDTFPPTKIGFVTSYFNI
jgi:hypothetical protein